MLADRPWNSLSLVRLASGILIAFGVSNVLPLLFTYWIGSSLLTPEDLADPGRLALSLSNPRTTNSVVQRVQSRLTPDTLRLLASYGSETNAVSKDQVIALLTNLFNQVLRDASLRSPEALAEFSPSHTASERLKTPPPALERIRLNRLILQEAFPAGLKSIHHAREAEPSTARFYQFLLANLILQASLFWVFCRLLRDEALTWPSFLQGSAPSVRKTLPFAITVGAVSTVAMLALSALSTWLLTHFDHTPRLQQPLEILQQARAPLEKFFFAYVALVGAPFFEETLFRGILYPAIKQYSSPGIACVLSAGVFGLIHGDAEKFLPLALFGMILVRVYEHTGTLIAPMITHACFNSINFALFLQQEALHAQVQNPPPL